MTEQRASPFQTVALSLDLDEARPIFHQTQPSLSADTCQKQCENQDCVMFAWSSEDQACLTVSAEEYANKLGDFQAAEPALLPFHRDLFGVSKMLPLSPAQTNVRGNPVKTVQTSTVTQCQTQCINTRNCSGIRHNNNSEVCELFDATSWSLTSLPDTTKPIQTTIKGVQLRVSTAALEAIEQSSLHLLHLL
ncbi:PAN domain-containing protein [bacterium]|nr:PAN domain-containing protein [bacterium]